MTLTRGGTRLVVGVALAFLLGCSSRDSDEQSRRANSGPRDHGSWIIPNEILIETDGSRSVTEIKDDLREIGVPVVEVTPLLAGTMDPVPQRPVHRCLQIAGVSFKVETEKPVAASLITDHLRYVVSSEPHAVRTASVTPNVNVQVNAIRKAVREKDHETVLRLTAEFFDTQPRTLPGATLAFVAESRLEALRALGRDDEVLNEVLRLCQELDLDKDRRGELHRQALAVLKTKGDPAALRAWEDTIIADRELKFSLVGREIRMRRMDEEKKGAEARARFAAIARIDTLIAEEKWVEAAELAWRQLHDHARVVEILEPHWKTIQDKAQFVRAVKILGRMYVELKKSYELATLAHEMVQRLVPADLPEFEPLLIKGLIAARTERVEIVARLEDAVVRLFPGNPTALQIVAERARVQTEQQAAVALEYKRIYEFNDPLNKFLWGFHSRTEVRPLDTRSWFIRTLTSQEAPPSRYDLHVIEALRKIQTFHPAVVAVIDSGIDANHPDLKDMIAYNAGEMGPWLGAPRDSVCRDLSCNGVDDDGNGFKDDVVGFNFVSGTGNTTDDDAHGTHVSGTIAAAFNGVGVSGVNPGARILPVKVLDDEGRGTVQQIAAGVAYAVAQGARVINLSLGGPYASPLEQRIYACANEEGAIVVAAAGNNGSNIPNYPSDFENVISVAASTYDGERTSFSNYSLNVDITAPGLQILSTFPMSRDVKDESIYTPGLQGYASFSGTSMATPMVAGIASLLLSAHPEYTRADVIVRLLASGLAVNSANDRRAHYYLGAGIADAAAALDAQPQPLLRVPHSQKSKVVETETVDVASHRIRVTFDVMSEWIPLTETPTDVRVGEEFQGFVTIDNYEVQPLNGGSFRVILNLVTQPALTAIEQIPIGLRYGDGKDVWFGVKIEPFLRRYAPAPLEYGGPDSGLWLPGQWSLGLWSKLQPDGSVWTGSIRKIDRQWEDELVVGRMSQDGQWLPGFPRTFRVVGLFPELVPEPFDWDGDGYDDVVIGSSNASRDTQGRNDGEVLPGVQVLSAQGQWIARASISTGGILNILPTHTLGGSRLTVVRTEGTAPGFGVDVRPARIDIFGQQLETLSSTPVSIKKNSEPLIASCAFVKEGGETPVVLTELPSRVAMVIPPGDRRDNPVDTEVRVFNASGAVENIETWTDEVAKDARCGTLVPNEGHYLVTNGAVEGKRVESVVKARSLAVMPSQLLWSKRHSNNRGRRSIRVVELRDQENVIPAVIYNSDPRGLMVAAGATGLPLAGFPARAPRSTLISGFLSDVAIVDWDHDGRSDLVVNEPARWAHVYSFDGALTKSYELPGNVWGSGVGLPGGQSLWLTGHRGIHKLLY